MLLQRVCITAAVAATLFATAGTATAAPSRFDNGSFESPVVAAGTFDEMPTGSTIGPWKVLAGGVDHIGAGFWQAAEGDQSVDLNQRVPGGVEQTFTTVPGKTYTVTYSLAGNPGGPSALKTGKALIDGQNVQDFTFDVTGKSPTNMGYVDRQFTFVARHSTTTLGFASTTSGATGPVIDDVRVQSCCSGSSSCCH